MMTTALDVQAMTLHLELLGKNGKTRLRSFPPKKGKAKGGAKFGIEEGTARIELEQERGRNIGFVVNNGGDDASSITECVAFFADMDTGTHDEQLERLAATALPEPTFRVRTKRGFHFYWTLAKPMRDKAAWLDGTNRIIAALGGDPSCKDVCRVMRLAGTFHVGDYGDDRDPVGLEVLSGVRYKVEQVLGELPALPEAQKSPRNAYASCTGGDELAEVLDVLKKVPPRTPGTNTRDSYLRLLWSLAAIVGPDQAGQVFSAHSPEWAGEEDLFAKAAEGDGRLGIGTFFWTANRKFGVVLTKQQQESANSAPVCTVELIRESFDQLLVEHPNDNRTRLIHRCRELVEADLDVRPTQELYRRELGEAYLRRDGVEIKPFAGGDVLPTEDLPCLVDGVFIRGALNILGADPKCGKTLFVVGMLAAMLHDTGTWLGHEMAPPPAVVIIGPDQPINIWANQLKRVGLLPDGRLHPKILRLWDSTNPWAAGEEGLAELRKICADNPGTLVIVDSLAKVCEKLGLDENSAEIGGVVSDIERAVVAAGGTPVLIHHNAKGAVRNGVTGGSALRGSGAIRANASQVASLSHINPDDKNDPRRRLMTEGRLGRPIDVVIECDWEPICWRMVCDYAAVQKQLRTEKKRNNLTELQEQVLAAVEATAETVTSRWVYEQLNPDEDDYDAKLAGPKAVYKALQSLTTSGLLEDGPKVGTSRTFRRK